MIAVLPRRRCSPTSSPTPTRTTSDAQRIAASPPQAIHWFDDGSFRPHVYALKGDARSADLQARLRARPERRRSRCTFFAHGDPLQAVRPHPDRPPPDRRRRRASRARRCSCSAPTLQGRDLWSRLMYATRISLTIGLVGVALSLVLGIMLGGISGLLRRRRSTRSSSASSRSCARSRRSRSGWGWPPPLPHDWSVMQVYFAITIIISLIGWTELARVVRGRFLSLREEDFVMAAELVGLQPAADHLPPHGAVVPQPHHRRDHAGAPGDDHQRDVAELPRPRPAAARRSAGACCCRRRRTSRRWRSRPGCCCRRCR